MKIDQRIILIAALFFVAVNVGHCQSLQLPAIYSSDMVLQRDTTIIVGYCKPSAEVVIALDRYTQRVITDEEGEWKATFYGIQAGGPFELKVSSSGESKLFKNVLVGDVWLASGQSNMEWTPAQGVDGWEEEKNKAYNKNIRLFQTARNPQISPISKLKGHEWKSCTPENASEFSAVAYFFSKYTQESQNIPIGIINSSFGGTRIEAWMSDRALELSNVAYGPKMPLEDFEKANRQRQIDIAFREEIFSKINVGKRFGVHQPNFDDTDWTQIKCPQNWADTELRKAGFVWFRKNITIEDVETFRDSCKLSLGNIVHLATVFINGKQLENKGDLTNFYYHFPSYLLKNGQNTIAVRVLKKRNPNGGFMGNDSTFYLASLDKPEIRMDLSGLWKFNKHIEPSFPRPFRMNPRTTLLFNGMIAPLTPLKIKGVLWYQGESNANSNFNNYDQLLKAMITDWRTHFQSPDLPFLIVQLANFTDHLQTPSDGNWARLRERQAMVKKMPNVMMASIIDLGEAKDIHPRNKKDVGYRLALLARNHLYGEKRLLSSGPALKSVNFRGSKATLVFENVGEGFQQGWKTIKRICPSG